MGILFSAIRWNYTFLIRLHHRHAPRYSVGRAEFTDIGENMEEEGKEEREEPEHVSNTAPQMSGSSSLLVILLLCIFCSWVCGACGLSFAWVILLMSTVAAMWFSSINVYLQELSMRQTVDVQRKRALATDESAEWFNFLFKQWWMFSHTNISKLIKEFLDPQLDSLKPNYIESLEVCKFTLGDQTPVIKGIRSDILKPSNKFFNEQVVIKGDVCLACDQFCLLLKARLGGKAMGMEVEIAAENLHIEGSLCAILEWDLECPFPHFRSITFTFDSKPDVWFNVKIFKAIQMMEVPLLKTWLHNVVMEAVSTALVNPGGLTCDIQNPDSFLAPPSLKAHGDKSAPSPSKGVLILSLTLHPGKANIPAVSERWFVVRVGSQKKMTAHTQGQILGLGTTVKEKLSFLVEDPVNERLSVKLKVKRMISTLTFTHCEALLKDFNLNSHKVIQASVTRKGFKSPNDGSPHPEGTGVRMRLEYVPIPPVNLNADQILTVPAEGSVVSGVLYVCVHGAQDLKPTKKDTVINPYCIIFYNREKIQSTHWMGESQFPKWDLGLEFLVKDYTQAVLSFAVCSWNPAKMAEADLLGLASYTPSKDQTSTIQEELPLSYSLSSHNQMGEMGTITVSVVFRPVEAVADNAKEEVDPEPMPTPVRPHPPKIKHRSSANQLFRQALNKCVIPSAGGDSACIDVADLMSQGRGLLELCILQARNLVAKDLNGFSDPYCEVKVEGELKFKTSIKKKTLDPWWGETVTTTMPRQGEMLDIIMWDHDSFRMRDFLGNIQLSVEVLRELSEHAEPQWYHLKRTKSGEIQVSVRIVSEDSSPPPEKTTQVQRMTASNSFAHMIASPFRKRPKLCRSRALTIDSGKHYLMR